MDAHLAKPLEVAQLDVILAGWSRSADRAGLTAAR
jgi:hypothetical protein